MAIINTITEWNAFLSPVIAAATVANIVKSSLGPVGLDKMIVDDVGDVTVTNDGATILKLLEVEHPAARVLVELAQLQDEEVREWHSYSSWIIKYFLYHLQSFYVKN